MTPPAAPLTVLCERASNRIMLPSTRILPTVVVIPSPTQRCSSLVGFHSIILLTSCGEDGKSSVGICINFSTSSKDVSRLTSTPHETK